MRKVPYLIRFVSLVVSGSPDSGHPEEVRSTGRIFNQDVLFLLQQRRGEGKWFGGTGLERG